MSTTLDARKINNLIKAGIPCNLAEKVVDKGFSLTAIKNTGKLELSQHFESSELTALLSLKRKPIPQEIVDRLFEELETFDTIKSKLKAVD